MYGGIMSAFKNYVHITLKFGAELRIKGICHITIIVEWHSPDSIRVRAFLSALTIGARSSQTIYTKALDEIIEMGMIQGDP